MIREKYLQECANLYLAKTYESLDSYDIEFISCIIDAFEAGAEWADANPNSGVVDLSQFWHDSNEIPREDSLIIFQSVYGGDILLRRFVNRKSGMASIYRWAYVDDLLPKGGEL